MEAGQVADGAKGSESRSNGAHLLEITSALEARGIGFRSLSEAIDTTTASGRLLFHVMGAIAEFERGLISERTRAGVAAAKARGQQIGRTRKLSDDDARWAADTIAAGRLSCKEVATLLDVAPLTVLRSTRRIEAAVSRPPLH